MWTEMGAGSIGTHSQRAKHFYSFCKFLWYFTSADLRLAPWSYDLSVQPFSKWCTNWQVPLYKGRCQIPWTNRSRKADSFLPLSFVEVAITPQSTCFHVTFLCFYYRSKLVIAIWMSQPVLQGIGEWVNFDWAPIPKDPWGGYRWPKVLSVRSHPNRRCPSSDVLWKTINEMSSALWCFSGFHHIPT